MMNRNSRRIRRWTAAGLGLVALGHLGGCEVNSFFNPSKTGRFHFTPTTVPVLERIDVIEPDASAWGETTDVIPEDLIPNDLTYRLSPADLITVEIYELFAGQQWTQSQRRIDASGNFRIPIIGDIQAAGLTAQELEDRIVDLLKEGIMVDPQVNVVVEDGAGFRYTVYGAIAGNGMYTLRNPDLHLIEALSVAGGAPINTETVYVIRQVALTEEVLPEYERDTTVPTPPAQRQQPAPPPVDLEKLIEQLDEGGGAGSAGGGGVSPAAFSPQNGEPQVDVDELQPVRVSQDPQVDIDELRRPEDPRRRMSQGESFIYDEDRGEWIRVRGATPMAPAMPGAPPEMILERIIKIPYPRLRSGDSSYNIVVRPDDRIYVEGPPPGVVYLDGEVLRPGVYQMPGTGKLTLSRLVTAAGGLGGLAIPERIDLTRVVGENREATIRVNLQAIRQRTEPDIVIKPDDHILVGTSFWATPLAVVRNGFRATYGFGFLLDRNFGNDVFGPPPVNRFGL